MSDALSLVEMKLAEQFAAGPYAKLKKTAPKSEGKRRGRRGGSGRRPSRLRSTKEASQSNLGDSQRSGTYGSVGAPLGSSLQVSESAGALVSAEPTVEAPPLFPGSSAGSRALQSGGYAAVGGLHQGGSRVQSAVELPPRWAREEKEVEDDRAATAVAKAVRGKDRVSLDDLMGPPPKMVIPPSSSQASKREGRLKSANSSTTSIGLSSTASYQRHSSSHGYPSGRRQRYDNSLGRREESSITVDLSETPDRKRLEESASNLVAAQERLAERRKRGRLSPDQRRALRKRQGRDAMSATVMGALGGAASALSLPSKTSSGRDRNGIEFRSSGFSLEKFAEQDRILASRRLALLGRSLQELRRGESSDVPQEHASRRAAKARKAAAAGGPPRVEDEDLLGNSSGPLDPAVDDILAALPPTKPGGELNLSFPKLSNVPRGLRLRQTPLQRERMMERLRGSSAIRTARCGLCQHQFARINLPTPVTKKAVYALLESWGADPPHSAAYNALHKQPPLCYERVNVCRFCTQFFDSVADELLSKTLTSTI